MAPPPPASGIPGISVTAVVMAGVQAIADRESRGQDEPPDEDAAPTGPSAEAGETSAPAKPPTPTEDVPFADLIRPDVAWQARRPELEEHANSLVDEGDASPARGVAAYRRAANE